MAHACKVAGRKPDEVTLVAVSKTHPAEAIEPLLEAGQMIFGENRVQEAQAKWPALRERWPTAELHLVGSLQSNKAADADLALEPMDEAEAAERELQGRRIRDSRPTLAQKTRWVSSTNTEFDGTYRHLLRAARAKEGGA